MILPWKRFWVSLGTEISCGISGQGFFDDPEAEPGFLNKSARHLDDLVSEQCLVLLGEPGLGKSIALEQVVPEINHAAGGDETTIWIRFRDIPDASTFSRRILESTPWRSWLEGDHQLTLVLDGLDEGLIKIKNFVSFLTSELRSYPLSRLRLLVVCRTADWPIAAGRQLLDLWKSDLSKGVWELCPLRRIDVVSAAESDGVSPIDFLHQIFAKNVVALAARPTTLFFLLRQFKSDGQLEGSHREIYERGILDLCREPDPERAEANKFSEKEGQITSPEKLRDGAALLAAMLILSGRSAISTSNREDTAVQGDLHLHSLVGNERVHGSGNQLHVLASVSTALFASRGENRVGFAHQSFAECLAARQVCNLPLVQLRKLFCGVDGNEEHVIPQLAETAAWLAGTNDDFLTHLLRSILGFFWEVMSLEFRVIGRSKSFAQFSKNPNN
jgi:predicted NACHT family NTPase